jgi:SAM-dependent methyltransferase
MKKPAGRAGTIAMMSWPMARFGCRRPAAMVRRPREGWMMAEPSYEKYVKDEAFLAYYNDYQKRYADQIAERDKVLLGLIAEKTRGQGSLLDIGCSTGNLLLHIRRAFPGLVLYGGDLAQSSIEAAAALPELETAIIGRMDMLDITGKYDCIVANAVAVYFEWDEYEKALASVARALRPGGVYIAFEWLHPHNQELRIVEKCLSHPDGLKYWFRSFGKVSRILDKNGMEEIEFTPFLMPFDIPAPEDKSGDTVTYTERLENGNRISMRGSLYQPWCHMVARKRS